MRCYWWLRQTTADLATLQAIDKALARAGIGREDVKFLAVATSTGFLIPGLTCHLVENMRLSPHIQRADVVGMGCHAGLNVLQVLSLSPPLPTLAPGCPPRDVATGNVSLARRVVEH